jgi:hypothetical protein
MRGHQNDGVNAGISQYVLVSVRQGQVFAFGEATYGFKIHIHAFDHTDTIALLQTINNSFSPPSEADYGDL